MKTVVRHVSQNESDFRTTPEFLVHWIDDLPLHDHYKTMQLLYEALGHISRDKNLSSVSKLELLNMLEPPLAYAISVLKRAFLRKSFPLSSSAMNCAKLVARLQNAMSSNYLKALAQTPLEEVNTHNLICYSQLVKNALLSLEKSFITCYQTYQIPTTGLWRESHKLYHITSKLKKQTRLGLIITNNQNESAFNALHDDISTTYKRILLLSLAQPYRFNQHELEHLYHVITRCACDLNIAQVENRLQRPRGIFLAYLENGQAPCYFSFEKDLEQDDCLIIDTSSLVSRIHSHLHHESIKEFQSTPNTVLERLRESWDIMPSRKLTRTHRRERATISLGLDYVHQLLSMKEQKQFPSSTEIPTLLSTAEERVAKRNPKVSAELINSSESGACVLIHTDGPKIGIGHLVAIKRPEDLDWQISSVKWIRQFANKTMEAGIEILDHKAEALTVYSREPAQQPLPAIILPEHNDAEKSASMLLPSASYKRGDAITINMHGIVQSLLLTKQINNTEDFTHFHFKSFNEQAPKTRIVKTLLPQSVA